jgi:hypothetical protein
MILDVIGRGFVASALVNGLGIAVLIAAARIVTWIKSEPWRRQPAATPVVDSYSARAAPETEAA